MRIKAYLLILLSLALACKGESQKNTETETFVSVKQENENAAEVPDVTPVNIKDIFLLLPDDAFPMEGISLANRKGLLNYIGDDKAYDISPTPIDVCDVKNGFLSLTGMQYGWEMCYWNLKDARKLVAVNSGTESGSEIRTFFYQNGELTEDHNYQLGGNQIFTLSDFVDVSQLSSNTRKYAEQQFAKGAYSLYYQLPQKGTSLTVTIDTYQLMENNENYEIPYEATKKVVLKWINEKWVK